jgi:hypothetical protein
VLEWTQPGGHEHDDGAPPEKSRAAQDCVARSLHLIARTHVAIETSLVRIMRRRAIAGGTDADEASLCGHNKMRFTGHGSYEEACKERETFAADFKGFYVSPVYRQGSGGWGWDLCPHCRMV